MDRSARVPLQFAGQASPLRAARRRKAAAQLSSAIEPLEGQLQVAKALEGVGAIEGGLDLPWARHLTGYQPVPIVGRPTRRPQ